LQRLAVLLVPCALSALLVACDPSDPPTDASAPPTDAAPPDGADAAAPDDAAPDASIDRYRPAALRALDYLETTEDEFGIDVVAAAQMYGDLTGEPRALDVATALRARLLTSELDRYPGLLDGPLPPLSLSSLDGVTASPAPPDPLDELADDRASRCLEEPLACTPSAECLAFVNLDDRWGYVLTHQAVWLLFAHWSACDDAVFSAIDIDERRHTFAANLVREMQADPAPTDLAFERMALLGHLGFAAAIDPAWLDALVDAQQPNGCLPLGPGQPCHPHATGVAVWALAHAP